MPRGRQASAGPLRLEPIRLIICERRRHHRLVFILRFIVHLLIKSLRYEMFDVC